MSKFLYVSLLLLVTSLFISPSHAMQPWEFEQEYEQKGPVFHNHTCPYKIEKNGLGLLKYSPKNPRLLSPATVLFIGPTAILHNEYAIFPSKNYEGLETLLTSISFDVTSNPGGLTELSEDLPSFPIMYCGPIPLLVNPGMTHMYVGIDGYSSPSTRTSLTEENYNNTLAGAFFTIISEFIPKTREFSGIEKMTLTAPQSIIKKLPIMDLKIQSAIDIAGQYQMITFELPKISSEIRMTLKKMSDFFGN